MSILTHKLITNNPLGETALEFYYNENWLEKANSFITTIIASGKAFLRNVAQVAQKHESNISRWLSGSWQQAAPWGSAPFERVPERALV